MTDQKQQKVHCILTKVGEAYRDKSAMQALADSHGIPSRQIVALVIALVYAEQS